MKIQRIIIITIILFINFLWVRFSFAAEPINNKFGIHLAVPTDEDLDASAQLVNSSGGDWGYVTLVIQENDRNTEKWQGIFDRLRRLHLIPIIRLATGPQGDMWRKPEKIDAESWASFLDGLHWVIKNRYIILFNEPNHAKEWGGTVSPLDYAQTAGLFAKTLKKQNEDFFVMLAGFDAAAPSRLPSFEDESIFLKEMISSEPSIFDYVDGWVSHSYPNPGFLGTPYETGRNSIRNYEWELSLLPKLGVSKKFPVFITETGWLHTENQPRFNRGQNSKIKSLPRAQSSGQKLTPEKVAEYIQIAYERVWLPDKRVRAVTPFILRYDSEPFASFSWSILGDGFYPQYYAAQEISKKKGDPEQNHIVFIKTGLGDFQGQELIVNSVYEFKIEVINQGQAILDQKDGYTLAFFDEKDRILPQNDPESGITYFFSDFSDVVPFSRETIDLYLKTGAISGINRFTLGLIKNNKLLVSLVTWDFSVIPRPSLTINLTTWPKLKTEAHDVEIQVFNRGERLVFRKKGIAVHRGRGKIEEVHNVVIGQPYRVVAIKPYYVPRQTFIIFEKQNNYTTFEKLIPIDFNRDGKFSYQDAWSLIKNISLLRLWWIR